MSARRAPIAQDQLRVPAQVLAYVEVLGLDDAAAFLLAFGGGYSYFSADPDPASALAQAVGAQRAAALAARIGTGSTRIPTSKPFLARYFRARKGLGPSAIARKLHVSDVSVRNWLSGEDQRQMTLFDLPPRADHKPL